MSTPIPQPSQKAPPPPDDADESSDDEPSSPMDAAAAIAAADAAADEISSEDDSDEDDTPTTTTTVPVAASHSVISASLAHAPLIPLKGHSHTSHTTTSTSTPTTTTTTTTHIPITTVAPTSTTTTTPTPTTSSTTTASVIPSTWPTSTSTSTLSATYTPTVTSYTQPLYGTTSTYTTTTTPTYVTTSHFPPPLYGYSTRIPTVQPPRIPTLPTLIPTPSIPSIPSPRIISEWTMEDDWILTHICRVESDMEKITLLGCFSRAFDLSAITSRWEQLMSDTTWPQRMNALPSSVIDVARQRLKEAKEKQEIRIRDHRQAQAVYGNHILGSRPQPIDPLLLPRKSQLKKPSTSTPTPITGPVIIDPDVAWEKYAQRENSALAVLRTHQSDYFITATKTVVGRHAARTTLNAQDVDINLINERDGIKVAREQAVICFHPSGNFTIKNVGKRPIHVDGWCLGPSKRCRLTHQSVINLNGPTGIFDINHHLIAQCQKMVEKIQQEKAEKNEIAQPMITTS